MGHDVNAEGVTADDILRLACALYEVGVTSFVPTVITAAEESIVAALRAVAAARQADPLVRHAIPYAHVEGPHLSPEDGPRGAHPRHHIRPPNFAEFEHWQRASGRLVGMVTLSPHYAEAPAYIAALTARGIHVAIGHTDATPGEITTAVDAGAVLSTHLGNGAHATLPRHPNLLWTQLAEDRLAASFIADGHHLPAETLTAMVRAKGLERCLLVSDTVALAGLPPGHYRTPVGGEVELTVAGRLGVVGTPYLAGAARSLAQGVGSAVRMARITLAQALRMATLNPGRFAGGSRGEIRIGAPADLLRFRWQPGDETLDIETVLVDGVQVH